MFVTQFSVIICKEQGQTLHRTEVTDRKNNRQTEKNKNDEL